VAADDAVRVVVLTGAGRGFSAGADLKPISEEELRRTEAPSFPGDLGGDILDRGNRCILHLRELAKPVLGSINGDAVGIGCSLALATDLRIASEAARFGDLRASASGRTAAPRRCCESSWARRRRSSFSSSATSSMPPRRCGSAS
jgi:enoyl-CoA hydratase/carnithine racemase